MFKVCNAVFRVCNPSEYIYIYIYIHFKTLPGTTVKNAAQSPLVGTYGPAIPVQRSNQLSYKGQLLSCDRKFMYI
jgi:hypothetical protein